MPRFIDYNPNRYSISERERRRKYFSVRGYRSWIDPFPAVQGTLPEKIVYEALSRRGIQFWFQNEVKFAIPEIDLIKNYRPDFVIPGLKIIIEVQGAYWHSKPSAIESDSYKFALYEMTGWTVLSWWDFDIIDNVNLLFMNEPRLRSYGVGSLRFTETNNGRKVARDDSKGIVTMNRRRGQRLAYRKKPITVKKPKTKGLRTYGIFNK